MTNAHGRHDACDAFGPGDSGGFYLGQFSRNRSDYRIFSRYGVFGFTSYETYQRRGLMLMALLFLIVGVLSVITAIKGNVSEVAQQLEKDFIGQDSFWLWVGLLLALSVTGRAFNTPQASRMLIMLIIAVYVISRKGVFTKFEEAFNQVTAPDATPTQDVGKATDAHNQGAGK
jgi:hypothetical protein